MIGAAVGTGRVVAVCGCVFGFIHMRQFYKWLWLGEGFVRYGCDKMSVAGLAVNYFFSRVLDCCVIYYRNYEITSLFFSCNLWGKNCR